MPASADAAIVSYARTSRDFATRTGGTVDLLVRGYIDDDCLLYDAECLTQYLDKPRPEATAQAKVIRELSFLARKNHIPLDSLLASSDPVQWEVGPTSGVWRIDVVLDRPDPRGTFGLMEVRVWEGVDTVLDVSDLLALREQQTGT